MENAEKAKLLSKVKSYEEEKKRVGLKVSSFKENFDKYRDL